MLKRVNIDRVGIRSEFLDRGTIAQGAAETGAIESYMNGRLARNVLMSSAAAFKGTFVCGESNGGFTKDTQWLVWDFESDCTLGDALEGKIGTFPGDVEEIVLGKQLDNADVGKRDMLVVQTIMKRVRTDRRCECDAVSSSCACSVLVYLHPTADVVKLSLRSQACVFCTPIRHSVHAAASEVGQQSTWHGNCAS